MNRRTLFGRLATVAAAATVAAHVEPARTEAAIATNTTELAKRCLACPWVGSWSSDISVERAIEQMREFSKHVTEAHGSRVTNSDTVWRRPYDNVPPVTISCDLGGATADDAIPLRVADDGTIVRFDSAALRFSAEPMTSPYATITKVTRDA